MGIPPRKCDDHAIKTEIKMVKREIERVCRETGATFVPTHKASLNKNQKQIIM